MQNNILVSDEPSAGATPRISVLMPTYNGKAFIQDAVESVLAQRLTDWELLISDDGSKDGTREFLRELQDPRIRVVEQPTNLGIFGNLNYLLRQAKAPVAKILCQDDILLPNCLERVESFMEAHPTCAVSRCLQSGHEEWVALRKRHQLEITLPEFLQPKAALLAFATFGNIVGNLCKATCRPAMVLEAGGFDQSYPYAGDYEGWSRIAARHGIALQNEQLVVQRRHADQNSNLLNKKNELFPQLNRLLEKLYATLSEEDGRLLRRHWAVHFMAQQRVPRLLRQVAHGQFRLARTALENLPVGISPFAVILSYPAMKMDLPWANASTEKLFSRIIALNGCVE